jgi:uncharacterized protein YpmS
MNKKYSMLILLALAILIVLICITRKTSGYDPKCNRTIKTSEEGAMCYNSSNVPLEPAVTDVTSCCNTDGNKWQLASQIE